MRIVHIRPLSNWIGPIGRVKLKYGRSSYRQPPWKFEKVVLIRAGRLPKWSVFLVAPWTCLHFPTIGRSVTGLSILLKHSPDWTYISSTGSLWKLQSTPVRLFLKSGPCSRCFFRDWPSNWAEKSKTTLILLGFLGWYTPWCGMYHTELQPSSGWVSCGTFSA